MAVETRNPTSDEAVAGTWSGSAGTRYTLVDDFPDSAGADFLTHGLTAGNITFGYTAFSLATTAVISQLKVSFYGRRTGAGNMDNEGRLKVNGSYYNVDASNFSTTFELREAIWTTNPNTTEAWKYQDVNGTGPNPLQAFGFFSTDADPTLEFASIQLEVTYTLVDFVPRIMVI